MKKIIYGVICSAILLFSVQVSANELLVLIGENSKNSKRWQDEVFQDYAQSNIGNKFPAKVVTIQGNNFPKWFIKAMEEDRIGEILGTPTFIIWDEVNKKEVGRFEGYTQKSRFYLQLNEAVLQVGQGFHPGRRPRSGGHREGSGGNPRQEGSGGMSRDIVDHIYKTPEEARRVSERLGFGGEIHSHETPEGTIYMPGPTL
tara:strand:+ start:120 stop:722 length:603 start_codon:yes stop_codon:yes gene_type:complete